MRMTIQKFKRADQLLWVLAERCDGNGLHWVPSSDHHSGPWVNETNERIPQLYGAGDARALDSLLRNGYAVYVRNTHGYEITEEGRLRVENVLRPQLA